MNTHYYTICFLDGRVSVECGENCKLIDVFRCFIDNEAHIGIYSFRKLRDFYISITNSCWHKATVSKYFDGCFRKTNVFKLQWSNEMTGERLSFEITKHPQLH